MNIKNQKSFIEKLNVMMAQDGDSGLEFFKENWPKLDNDDRKMLTTLIAVGVGRIVGLDQHSLEQQLSWLAVVNYSEKPIEDGKIVEEFDDNEFPRLSLAEGVNGNQITKIFRDLKKKGVLTSSYDLIAEAISIIFHIDESTAYKDLTEEKRLAKVTDLLP
jgi:hypothetical protein